MTKAEMNLIIQLAEGDITIDENVLEQIYKLLKKGEILTSYKVKVLKAIKNKEFIKKCLLDKDISLSSGDRLEIILSIEDTEFYKECVENANLIGLEELQEVELVEATKDAEYIKQYIEKRKEVLDSEQKADLIIATNDIEYMKWWIANKNRYGHFLYNRDVVRLISSTKDIDYIEECIKSEELKLGTADKAEIVMRVYDDKDIFRKLIEYNIIRPNLEQEKNKITLPPNMTIGIEIESEGRKSRMLRVLKYKGWEGDVEYSITNGAEVRSPKLSAESDQNAEESIYEVNSILKACGQRISKRCGGHIHIGADYLTCPQSYINLVYLLKSTEYILYLISNEAGNIPREQIVVHAEPFSEKLLEGVKDGTIDVNDEESMKNIVEEIQDLQVEKKSWSINFLNIGDKNKNTIEFRMPNGTLNPDHWIENINLFGGIVKTAEEITHIQNKSEEEMSTEEKRKLQLFDEMSDKMSEEERLDKLLELVITGDKETYIEKFTSNKALVKKKSLIFEILKDVQKASSEFQINPTMIARKVFAGAGAVNGTKVQEAETMINSLTREREHENEIEY